MASRHRIIWEIDDPLQGDVASRGGGDYIVVMQMDASQPQPVLPLPILIVPAPILKTHAKPVRPEDGPVVAQLVPKMFASMYAAPGIGLAAPQVGVSLRLVVLDLMTEGKSEPVTLINPEIASASTETATREEGCLSLPGHYADVTRPAQVRVRYSALDGSKHEISAEGLLAACLQHEIDHLDGVLFIDHISALRRNMILRRMAKERRLKA